MATTVPPRHGEGWTALEDYYLRCHVNRWSQHITAGRLRYLAHKHQRNCNAICARINQKFGGPHAALWYGHLTEATRTPLYWSHCKPPAFVPPVEDKTKPGFIPSDELLEALRYKLHDWRKPDYSWWTEREPPSTFWMCVAVRGSSNPTTRHASEGIAIQEAERLGKMLNCEVIVVKSVGVVTPPPPVQTATWKRIST